MKSVTSLTFIIILCNTLALHLSVYLYSMKIACYILSFYFMALTGVACADTLPLDNTKDTVSVISSTDGNHNHDHQSDWDGCSPLCVCHCCHVHFVSAAGVDFTHLVKLPAVYTSYFQDFSNADISGFLKPPMS